MAKKGKRKRRCRLKLTNIDNNKKKKFTINQNIIDEMVEKSGGIITEKDIKDIFNIKEK